MTHFNSVELPDSGNAEAIASLINYLLHDTGITARAVLKDNCLQVMLESDQVPDPNSSLDFIRQMMMEWEIKFVEFIEVYGIKIGDDSPAWAEVIVLKSQNDKNFQPTSEELKSVDQNSIKLKKRRWPAWFPYPISWLRALGLLLIAFPLTSLIVFRLNIITSSALISSHDVLVIFAGYWVLLPTLCFSLFYHFLDAVVRSEKSSYLSKVILYFKGLWEGVYGTFIIGLSFLIILNSLAAFFVLKCSLGGAGSEDISSCIGREFGYRAWEIFDSVENFWDVSGRGVIMVGKDGFALRPWLVIWFAIAAYLYQVECLIRRYFTPKQLAKGLLVSLFAVVVASGIALSSKWPEGRQAMPVVSQKPAQVPSNPIMPKPIPGETPLPVPYAPAVATPSKILLKAPPQMPQLDPFPVAMTKAQNAVKLSKSAKSQDEWNLVVSQWRQASALMEAVPASSPNYAVAQQKAIEYQENLAYAQKAAATRLR
ncbi:hypothetical protein [Microcoleus sp. FACHB-68]|uniref:hypothetical protein n=1 Tax=Microcoleus sp. FACHB-68 TaxID=2692826 RepID=UPI001683DAD8|nr:hypothetical protein [Microcoleus sp. FACHB-68]MBD1938794.1 hypothetical protein [Microcoleus sp. FACHB-68]